MEDQQHAAGDLTDGSPDTGDLAETAAADTESTDTESADTESFDGEEVSATSPDTVDADEQPVRQRRPAGRWSVTVAAVAASMFVGASAFAGAMLQPYLGDRATVEIKLRVARTAANAITTLWTYSPENIDKLADRASQYLSGDFEASYRKYIDAIAAPNKQAQITNNTQVTGTAVESLHGADATAIVYTNTTSVSPATKDVPSLKYLSYRLAMQRSNARWLVTRMTTVTSLDLTPKL